MDIEYFKEHIHEELCGAKDYIIRAIEIKPMRITWSKQLVEMSANELMHATNLFNMFNEYYATLTSSYTQMPEYLVKAREEITEMYTECSTTVKIMHEMYK